MRYRIQKATAIWFTSVILLTLSFLTTLVINNHNVGAARSIVFPVTGPVRYSNDYNSPRSSGIHAATDIIANKLQHIVSASDGVVTYVGYPQPSWGYMVTIRDDDGYKYNYIHINNDMPGTDDGNGGPMLAYAPDIKVGNRVVKGQQIAWVGDSGNAETTVSHLHFEIIRPDGSTENPYDSLINAQIIPRAVNYPVLVGEILPYGADFNGGLSLAMGNMDSDQASEIITGAGPGGGPHVRVFDSNKAYLTQGFFAYSEDFRGGVNVATGDVDGDGVDEIITGAGPGGGPHVKIFELDGTVIGGFFAYSEDFRGGVNVATGDVDGDGVDEIITGAGPGGGPHVRVLKLNGQGIGSFFPYVEHFSGGVDVSGGDVDGDGVDEIITGAGPGGGPHVRVLKLNGQGIGSFFPYSEDFRGGVRVSAGNVQTSSIKSEILTVPASNGGPQIKMFNSTGTLLDSKMYMEEWWNGYYDIAAGQGASVVGTGVNRRSSLRSGI